MLPRKSIMDSLNIQIDKSTFPNTDVINHNTPPKTTNEIPLY